MKRTIVPTLLALAAGVLTLAAAEGAVGPSGSVSVQRGQPVEIAFAVDQSGFAADFAESLTNAVQMAVEAHPAIRGFPIQVNLVDAPCGDVAAGLAAAASIVAHAENVGVLGHVCSLGFDAALPLYEAAGLVTITGSASRDDLPAFGPTVFNRTIVRDGDGGVAWYEAVSLLPSVAAWREAYEARFGSAPTALADLYYDAASLLIRNLQKVSRMAGGKLLVIDRAALAEAVRGTVKYQGVTCTVTFDPATGNRLNDAAALARCAP